MDASLYFQLVDAIAGVRSPRDLTAITHRVATTPMHPLERRALDRALRARAEALDLHDMVRRDGSGVREPGAIDTRSVAR